MAVQPNVVIVDAYAPTRRLAPEFHRAGYEVVRVQSTPEPPLVYASSFDLSPYAANIVHTGDLSATVDTVAAYRPAAVVAGGELGVELADQLSEALGLLTNGTALSPARRDKYRQIETVRAAGLRAAHQLLVRDADQLARWHRELGGRVVVKPIRSAAGDGVSFCATPEESVAGYRAALGAENVFSARNEAVVAQEYLVGPEYVVDTVSRDGQHHVTDIWKYEKLTANGILDLTTGLRLLPRHGEAQEALVPYAFEVLDALGIAHGAAHLEIKLTPDGPCLVEVGARMAGLDMPHYSRECASEAQLEWIVDAYVRPERFAARWKESYRLRRHFVSAMTVSPADGRLRGYPLLPVVEQLESLVEIRPVVAPGGRLRRTVDDMTCPLIVNLRHEVAEVVERDFGTVRYLDGPSFYDVEE
ncbi:ATP-grasp domain-containing protein [Micromonospora sp. NPDC048830]|uniref:ATP-grasp domain-containing protein n=1 Tax=Micromonospora sp. NPDC048830 TaxID=3364257 RepID=UPI003716518D